MATNELTFGWFLPTSGDSTCLGDPAAKIPQSRELFDEVVDVVDDGGFAYLLMPVNATCWEATVTGAFYLARSRNVAPLVALRSAYCNPGPFGQNVRDVGSAFRWSLVHQPHSRHQR